MTRRRGPMVRHSRAAITALVVLAVLVISGTAWGYSAYRQSIDEATAGGALVTPRAEPEPIVVAVLGDSFTGGSDMNRGPEWPDILAADRGWILRRDGVGGSGYINQVAPGERLPERAKSFASNYAVDLVILAGGINDEFEPPNDVAAAARRTIVAIKDLHPQADILVLSPFVNGNPRPTLLGITQALRSLAGDEGVRFLDVTKVFAGRDRRFIGSDGTHPTDDGHEHLADAIGRALDSLGLPDPEAYDEEPGVA